MVISFVGFDSYSRLKANHDFNLVIIYICILCNALYHHFHHQSNKQDTQSNHDMDVWVDVKKVPNCLTRCV